MTDDDETFIPEAVWKGLLLEVLARMKREAPHQDDPLIQMGWPDEDKDETSKVVLNLKDFKHVGRPVVTVSGHGIFVADEGGMTVYLYDGSHFHHGLDGTVATKGGHVERIEVHDLRQVTRYEITHVYQTASHALQFAGGGNFSFLMDRNGKVLETLARRMCLRTDKETGVIRLFGESFSEGFEEDA